VTGDPEVGKEIVAACATEIDLALDQLLPPAGTIPGRVAEAMRWVGLAPGKRLRPALTLLCAADRRSAALPFACSVEMIHAFSLVHDDLPAMDDDAERRGRASCHVEFGHGTALLAGDALLARAFEILAIGSDDAHLVKDVLVELTAAMGSAGMLRGQALEAVSSAPISLEQVAEIHETKTAALFSAACGIGALVAGEDDIEPYRAFGSRLGMAFQIADDLADMATDPPDKPTWPSVTGEGAAREAMAALIDAACAEAPKPELADVARWIGVN